MAFWYIFLGIAIALFGIGFMGAYGLPWLKRFNERREKTDFLRVLATMNYDDGEFADWLSKQSR